MFKTEVCCGSFSDVGNAYRGGAARVELCSSLFFGGLTPSLGAFLSAKEAYPIEIAVMIRPREGGFCYSDEEFAVMRRDAALFIENGADAIVFGCLSLDGTINTQQVEVLVSLAKGRCETVFHKAFDVAKTPMPRALDQLIDLGVSRILTSGGQATAAQGSDQIKALIDQAVGRIQIMPGGGVRAANIGHLRALTGCTMAHTSAFDGKFDLTGNHDKIFFTGQTPPAQGEYKEINHQIIGDFTAVVKEF